MLFNAKMYINYIYIHDNKVIIYAYPTSEMKKKTLL